MVEGWARLELRRICACACLTWDWHGGVAAVSAVKRVVVVVAGAAAAAGGWR